MIASVDSGAPVTEYSGCSHSGPGACARIRPQPGQEPFRLRGGAEVHQRVDRHGAVPQPAVPVIPVPGAADPLRQRGGGRGQHGAGGLMDQGAEHQGRPADQGGFHGGQLQCLHPAPGMMRDGGAARVLLRRFGPLGFRVAAAQVQHHGAVPQLDVGGGGGMAAVRGDREADARCEQDDRVRRSHDVQFAAAGLHAEGRVGVVRAGRKTIRAVPVPERTRTRLVMPSGAGSR